MHITVNKKDLLPTLERCSAVADNKSTMPILAHVLLKADGDSVVLAATDLLVSVRGSVAATVEEAGSVALPARDLLERVRNMPDTIGIKSDKNGATTIRAVGTARRYTIQGIPADEFPSLPSPDVDAKSSSLAATALATLLAGTHFSISKDETRPHLNSALLEWDNEKVRMVTTDGHRLSKMEMPSGGALAGTAVLIPLKGVGELRRLCDEVAKRKSEEPTEIKVLKSGANAFFELTGYRFSVKLMDAAFPPYQQVIPKEQPRVVRVERDSAMDAMSAVSVAASDRTGGVKLSLSKGKIRFESQSPETGEGFDELDVDYDGEDIAIGLNGRYVLDVLRSLSEDEVEIGLGGELDPAVIRPVAGSDYVAVVMPMRI